LSQLGVKIHLHAYEYGREQTKELNKHCFTVDYYKRPKGIIYAVKSIPYIIATRNSKRLLENLLKDDYPILFEGIHTCLAMSHPQLTRRKKYIRAHNVEHDYYHHLSKSTKSLYKSMFFSIEARKLKKYERVIQRAHGIFAISNKDMRYFESLYTHVQLLPAFHASEKLQCQSGRGDYLIYHGNLSVEENIKAALFLIHEVFSKMDINCIITGKNPGAILLEAAAPFKHIQIVANPDDQKINELIREAHINVLPTFQDTGIKLKLLKSVSTGRFCISNSMMVKDTGLESLCSIKDKPEDMILEIQNLMNFDFTDKMIKERRQIWDQLFSNSKGAQIIINEIFPS